MTLLFAVLTKNDSFRSYSTFVYLLRAHILNINTCTYTTSAHGHELSGCVRADAYNLGSDYSYGTINGFFVAILMALTSVLSYAKLPYAKLPYYAYLFKK